MQIGLLETGKIPESLYAQYGSYPQMFEERLGEQNAALHFKRYAVVDGVFPETIEDCDGWLITGSRHGAYDALPWYPRLEAFIRELYAHSVPLVGICFGHQIIAQALGGKVEKVDKGWGIGLHNYTLNKIENPIMEKLIRDVPSPFGLYAMHQDQVTKLPEQVQLEVIASSSFCEYAGLLYGQSILTFQAHPEFTLDYEIALLERDAAPQPIAVAQPVLEALHQKPPQMHDSEQVLSWIAAFLLVANKRRVV